MFRAAERLRGIESNTTRYESAIPPYLFAVRSLSPRSSCRVDFHGDHTYVTADLPADFPSTPWALYLTDDNRQYRLIGIDLDDHNADRGALVARDLDLITGICDRLGIDYLVCASGQANGRHVWIHCDPTNNVVVARMADALKRLCTTVDLGPLSNPRTGCLRAPGSLHRAGGRSLPLPRGNQPTGLHAIKSISSPTPAASIEALTDELWHLAEKMRPALQIRVAAPRLSTQIPQETAANSTPVASIFARRPLPDFARALLATAPDGDASATAFTLARSFVLAGMTADDFARAALDDTAPGLEHIRTRNAGDFRQNRPDAQEHAVRQFQRAARTISPRTPDSKGRSISAQELEDITGTALGLARRASFWHGRSGTILQRTLAALCVMTLDRGHRSITADVRTWALTAGLTTEQISKAARALEAAGWLEQVSGSAGPMAARWQVRDLRTPVTQNSNTGGPTPGELNLWGRALTTSGSHSIWSLDGLGTSGHAVWQALEDGSSTRASLCGTTGLDMRTEPPQVSRRLLLSRGGWLYAEEDRSRGQRAGAADGVRASG